MHPLATAPGAASPSHAEAALAQAISLEETGQFRAAIDLLHATNRVAPDHELERRLVRLRRRAFQSLDRSARPEPVLPEVTPPSIDPTMGLAVIDPDAVSAPRVRAAIRAHGSVVVRGLLSDEQIDRLRWVIDLTLDARTRFDQGAPPGRWYDELEDVPKNGRRQSRKGGTAVHAADSPEGFFHVVDTLYEVGANRVVEDLTGESAAISFQKCTLRRIAPQRGATWHQDGAFLGQDVRSLNLWIALSDCGRDAPGLEVLPRRIDHIVETGGLFGWDVADHTVAKRFPDISPVRAEYRAGDAMFFDHLCLHRSAHGPKMTKTRYALECWFFAPSAYPEGRTGILI